MPTDRVQELFDTFVGGGLIDDRREYDVEDFITAYSDLSRNQARELQEMIEKEVINEPHIKDRA